MSSNSSHGLISLGLAPPVAIAPTTTTTGTTITIVCRFTSPTAANNRHFTFTSIATRATESDPNRHSKGNDHQHTHTHALSSFLASTRQSDSMPTFTNPDSCARERIANGTGCFGRLGPHAVPCCGLWLGARFIYHSFTFHPWRKCGFGIGFFFAVLFSPTLPD